MNYPVYFPNEIPVRNIPWWYDYCNPIKLLSLASDLDNKAIMTTDPLLQEELITRAAIIRAMMRNVSEVYDNPYNPYYFP